MHVNLILSIDSLSLSFGLMSIRILIMGPSLYCFDIFSNQFHSFGWSDSLFALVDLMIFSISGSRTPAWSMSPCETFAIACKRTYSVINSGLALFCHFSVCVFWFIHLFALTFYWSHWLGLGPALFLDLLLLAWITLTLIGLHIKVLGNGWVWDPCWDMNSNMTYT